MPSHATGKHTTGSRAAHESPDDRWRHSWLQDEADAFYERVDATGDPAEALVWTLRGVALEIRAHGDLMVWLAENRP